MVLGLWIQRFGVGFLGDSGPNAPIVLGTKSFSLSEINLFYVKCKIAVKDKRFNINFSRTPRSISHKMKLTLFTKLNDIVKAFYVDPEKDYIKLVYKNKIF